MPRKSVRLVPCVASVLCPWSVHTTLLCGPDTALAFQKLPFQVGGSGADLRVLGQ